MWILMNFFYHFVITCFLVFESINIVKKHVHFHLQTHANVQELLKQ